MALPEAQMLRCKKTATIFAVHVRTYIHDLDRTLGKDYSEKLLYSYTKVNID